ncbi:threonine/serine dehydratase [Atopobium sp. oral taxon 810]|uniref:threonine ammonia-lyase n=1 Tax=Atopobium sp. oral taxon 810 TaxID=712158 RepID=UPI0003965D46|nr:threonine/serine dehydratase [Atopobium sp. oral taxon 810]ERI05123.1 pyridoxal-phosphate dependent protein [Atopobium sp. oral taxon 810 str. F0209]
MTRETVEVPDFSAADVDAAYTRLKDHLAPTPVVQSYYLGGPLSGIDDGREYFFKLESMQRAKSFKIRGALNKMLTLTDEERARGVGTVSSGNHGSSVAYAGSMLGISATVIVPETCPQSKQDKIRYFGGTCLPMGKDYDEAHKLGMRHIEEYGLTYVDAYYDDPLIYAGQGTVAVELLAQLPAADCIVVPVGGGGLSTGIAVWAKTQRPNICIVGVQTEACPAMWASWRDGRFYDEYPIGPTRCDATVGGVGALAYMRLRDVMDELIVVTEDEAASACAFMAREEKLVAEVASCMTVAAVRDHREQVGGSRVALVISGGNIDGATLDEVLRQY